MHETHVDDESRRTAALALWRYGHDYLKAARTLCENDHIACNESQALYHLAAQGIEFALKSHLRAKGVTPGDLSARIGHSLLDALQEAMARDLAPPPVDVLRAIQLIAPYHRHDQFRFLAVRHGEFPDLAPLLAAGTWILAQTAKDVVADYFAYHGHASAPASEEMLRLMRADLQMTVRNIPTLQ
ncbi:MAG: hypothetical protein E6H66_17830 [Betaproteobacteria bacterium]|nr:MAG: hypothetical protein E6H66_17830 [Betaproteobacteria bacterium]